MGKKARASMPKSALKTGGPPPGAKPVAAAAATKKVGGVKFMDSVDDEDDEEDFKPAQKPAPVQPPV